VGLAVEAEAVVVGDRVVGRRRRRRRLEQYDCGDGYEASLMKVIGRPNFSESGSMHGQGCGVAV